MKPCAIHIASALSLAALAGCAAVPTRIPTGQWAGHGRYVDYEAVADPAGPAAVAERARSDTYVTTLKITPTRVFGREAFIFAIDSRHGTMLNLGGQATRGEVWLVQLQSLADGTTLYAVLDKKAVEAAQAPGDQLLPLPAGTIAKATALRTPEALVVRVDYLQPGQPPLFTDTFMFKPDRLVKTGSYSATHQEAGSNVKTVRVDWVEELRPRT